jgi:hypothetical protein
MLPPPMESFLGEAHVRPSKLGNWRTNDATASFIILYGMFPKDKEPPNIELESLKIEFQGLIFDV